MLVSRLPSTVSWPITIGIHGSASSHKNWASSVSALVTQNERFLENFSFCLRPGIENILLPSSPGSLQEIGDHHDASASRSEDDNPLQNLAL